MNERKETSQEKFWRTEFGDEYTRRCEGLSAIRQPFFALLLKETGDLGRVCELGANRGENLRALRALLPGAHLVGVEINPVAAAELAKVPGVESVCQSLLDFGASEPFDMVLVCGVLIHLDPKTLTAVYQKLFDLSSRFILINEYFNPSPVEIDYRGHRERLYKRDFAGEFLDLHSHKVKIVDYGFLWKRVEPGWDNTTWTLFQKEANLC